MDDGIDVGEETGADKAYLAANAILRRA